MEEWRGLVNFVVMIELINITAGYEGRRLIENASATLRKGELVGLLGANGTGKSTLLKILSGRLTPLDGYVRFDSLTYTPAERDMAKIVALVTTERVHAGALTTQEVVAMGRYPHTGFFGRLSTHDKEIVDDAINSVGMSAFKGKMMSTLSDGEAQKIMIARALAQDTPVILLDEPTAFLDAASRVEVLHLLSTLARTQNKAILLSTHDIAPILRIADCLWLVHHNRLIAGTATQLTKNPDGLVALFDNRQVHFNPERGDFE